MQTRTSKQKTADKRPVIKMGEETPEIIASAIVEVADAARKLNRSRLTQRAVHVLIKDQCGLSLADIKKVLEAAENLGRYVLVR